MLFIAVLFVIALIGLFVTIGLIIAGAMSFVKAGKRAASMVEPVKNNVIEIVNTGKGIGLKGKIRYDGYVKRGKRIYTSVKETADEVGAAARTVDVDGAKTAFQQAASSIGAAQEALAAAKAVADIFAKSRES
jgi:hypothetical protein